MKKNTKPATGKTDNETTFLGLPHNLGEFREAVSRLSAEPGNPDPLWTAAAAPLRASLIAWCEVTEATAAATLRAAGNAKANREAESSLALASANRKLVPLIEGLSPRVANLAGFLANEKRERKAVVDIEKHEFFELRARDIRNPVDGSLPALDQLDIAAGIRRAISSMETVPLDFREEHLRSNLAALQAEGIIDGELTMENARKRIEELEAEHARVIETIEHGLSDDEISRLRSLSGQINELEMQAADAARRADLHKAQALEKEEEIRILAESSLIIVDAVITAHEINLNSIPSPA